MLLNYLKLSFRLLVRNPFSTIINVLGLSIGFAAFFTLWQYASSELRADQYHPHHERIARLGLDWRFTDNGESWNYVKCGFFDSQTVNQFKADFPEVEDYVRIICQPGFDKSLVGYGSQLVMATERSDATKIIFKEEKGACADANLFEFFSVPLLYGDKKIALRDPNTIVLSQSISRKYFGSKNPMGEFMTLNGSSLKVTGVFVDLAYNTHLYFDFVISNAAKRNDWNEYTFPWTQNYILLKEGTAFSDFEKKINAKANIYWAEMLRDRPNVKASMFVQPLKEVAFSNNYLGDYFAPKSKPLLITFSIVAVVILLMAWINYVNLTLARTARRMKEVATRKTAGAGSPDFVRQFLVESLLTNLIGLAFAFTLLQVGQTPIELFLHLPAPRFDFVSLPSMGFFLTVIAIGIVITGLYPAWMAIRHNPRKLFSIRSGKTKSRLLPGFLTIFQYASATVLLLWVFVIYLQLTFIFKKGFGTGKDTIAVIESPLVRSDNFNDQMEYFQQKLFSLNLVQDATSSHSVDLTGYFTLKRSMDSFIVGASSSGGINEKFIPFFGITLLAGRNFQVHDRANAIIISRGQTSRLGFAHPEDAIGAKIFITHDGGSALDHWTPVEIIGVIEDYRTEPYFSFAGTNSRRGGEMGICLTYKDYLYSNITPERIAVKLDARNLSEVIPQIQALYNDVFPGNAFVLYFQDDHIQQNYQSEKSSRNQLVFFALLAIGISCLGLLGMISNKVTEKTKEIGIRKILGARLSQIAQILLTATLRQIIIATIIGIPIAYYLIRLYLEKFLERIELQWWHFALPVTILIVLLLTTIASVLLKAARTNPVDALKYE